MEKRNKIRDWETKRDELNVKLDLCEDKLRHQKQDQRPDDVKVNEERLAAAKVSNNCFNPWTAKPAKTGREETTDLYHL